MKPLDWAVLVGTLGVIVAYGTWKERGVKTAEQYLRGGRDLKWWTIGLSIMATQASAITFLSMPGQAYQDGMGFVQFYFGLPVAMVLLSALIVPIYYRLKVYTAYEYLEGRFDRKTRQLTAFLFLLSRGLAAGISIYAPAIVLSTVLGWSLQLTNVAIGGAVILYTVSGGARAVSRTQTYQMAVILGGMALAVVYIWSQLPADLGLPGALHLAGALGKMKVVDFSPRFDTRYTFWSGMTGGLFVALAYFGTDQSQVQRYLGGASLAESRVGLLMNGIVKIPMQLMILFVGVLLFVFYQFHQPPIYFDQVAWQKAKVSPQAAEARALEDAWAQSFAQRRERVDAYVAGLKAGEPGATAEARIQLRAATSDAEALRKRARAVVSAAHPGVEASDADYVFIGFVLAHFPAGLIGLLLAVILCAAMSATAAALSSLGQTTVVDFYKPLRPGGDDRHDVTVARWFTVGWGLLAVAFAAFASLLENLIQAVNILGSIFYGPMLGVFLVGFFVKRVRGTPVFWATLGAQAIVVAVWAFTGIGFLWYNVIGCAAVLLLALVLQALD
jgi:solute:Na+ symporter, SSS family